MPKMHPMDVLQLEAEIHNHVRNTVSNASEACPLSVRMLIEDFTTENRIAERGPAVREFLSWNIGKIIMEACESACPFVAECPKQYGYAHIYQALRLFPPVGSYVFYRCGGGVHHGHFSRHTDMVMFRMLLPTALEN